MGGEGPKRQKNGGGGWKGVDHSLHFNAQIVAETVCQTIGGEQAAMGAGGWDSRKGGTGPRRGRNY